MAQPDGTLVRQVQDEPITSNPLSPYQKLVFASNVPMPENLLKSDVHRTSVLCRVMRGTVAVAWAVMARTDWWPWSGRSKPSPSCIKRPQSCMGPRSQGAALGVCNLHPSVWSGSERHSISCLILSAMPASSVLSYILLQPDALGQEKACFLW